MNLCCSIEMLGPLRAVTPQRTITRFGTQKAGALLAFLALRVGRPCPREELIDLFWGDMDLSAGRDNLSTTLGTLRRLLEPPGVPRGGVLVADRAAVGLHPDTVSADVARFERLLVQARSAGESAAAAGLWGQAVALYGGDFLPGCYLDWAVREAERLQGLYLGALRAWTRGLEDADATGDALDAARRWASADPYSEEAGGALVRLLTRAGRPDAAREAYRVLEQTLREEFGTSPSPATRGPVEGLLSQTGGTWHEAPGPASRRSPPDVPPCPIPDAVGAAPHPAPLPSAFSRFFGREGELALMARLMPASDRPEEQARLVTLTGPGGIGKTRLATEFARRAAMEAGLWAGFVPLADLSAADRVLPHIAQTLGLPAAPGSDPLDRIVTFLAAQAGAEGQSVLLVLDNLEQVPGAADAVRALLERAPSLTCLCTSRRRVGLCGERLLPLAPLPVPDHQDTPRELGPAAFAPPVNPADLLVYPSVRLYVDRAQAARPDFQITPANAGAVAGLCRALEGSPLALELAASWVRSLPPRAMWERLARDLDGTPGLLEARYDDLPARHRSLWAALDWSFRLLPPTHQRLFARLSVFRGGWTLEDCRVVCDESDALGLLADLEEASLIRSEETAAGGVRWHILETVRRHAGARLRARGETGLVADRHLDRFLSLAEHADRDGRTQAHRLAALETEHDNLRAALDHAGEDPDAGERGLRLAAGLLPFWRARSHLREGQERTDRLLETPGAARPSTARAAALNCAGTLAMLQADYGAAEVRHAEALAVSQEFSDAHGSADALLGLGNVRFYSQDYPAAQRMFENSLALRRADDAAGIASACHSLGSVALRRGRYDDAADCYERAMRLRRGRGDVLGAAASLGGLGQVAVLREDYGEADRLTRAALDLFAEAGQQWVMALCLENLSRSAEAQGRPAQAAGLLGAATALRERFHFAVPPAERAGYEERLADLRALLGAPAFAAAWDAGHTGPWEQVVRDAEVG